MESGNGNGNGITETETETEYGIRERSFQAIDLKKKNVSNDNKINKQTFLKKTKMKLSRGDSCITRGVDSGEKTLDTTSGNECN